MKIFLTLFSLLSLLGYTSLAQASEIQGLPIIKTNVTTTLTHPIALEKKEDIKHSSRHVESSYRMVIPKSEVENLNRIANNAQTQCEKKLTYQTLFAVNQKLKTEEAYGRLYGDVRFKQIHPPVDFNQKAYSFPSLHKIEVECSVNLVIISL